MAFNLKLTDYHLLHLGDLGGIAGSVFGGRWSDYELARLKAANSENSYPEVSGPEYWTMQTLFIVRGALLNFLFPFWVSIIY